MHLDNLICLNTHVCLAALEKTRKVDEVCGVANTGITHGPCALCARPCAFKLVGQTQSTGRVQPRTAVRLKTAAGDPCVNTHDRAHGPCASENGSNKTAGSDLVAHFPICNCRPSPPLSSLVHTSSPNISCPLPRHFLSSSPPLQ